MGITLTLQGETIQTQTGGQVSDDSIFMRQSHGDKKEAEVTMGTGGGGMEATVNKYQLSGMTKKKILEMMW